ncbi:hypothetical protein JCM9279_002131 [Rhodotorula babjevae]
MAIAPPPRPAPLVQRRRAFHGTLVHALSLTDTEYLHDALIGVDEAGVIAFVDKSVSAAEVEDRLDERGWGQAQVVRLVKGEFLMPGLIDTHVHGPQFVNLSYGQEFELLDWLDKVTFPAEAKFADVAYARRTYEDVVDRLINSGTTTACLYGTLHRQSSKILAAICHRRGQRAFVGKCNMDRNSPSTYSETSTERSLADTEDFVTFVRERCDSPCPASSAIPSIKRSGAPTSLVQPILTPRFAISCTDECLQGLGEMMDRDEHLPLQTHLAENPSEVQFALSLYPGVSSYTAAYDRFRLLRRNTVLAHCVHLSDDELDLIKARNSGISICADSNFNLRSGTARVTDMLDKGIKVGLGTDVSGGLSLGILSAIRATSTASKTICFHKRDSPSSSPSTTSTTPSEQAVGPDGVSRPAGFFAGKHLSLSALFYLATLGGAQVANVDERVGNFVVGKEFDALLVQTAASSSSSPRGSSATSNGETGEHAFEDELRTALEGSMDEQRGEAYNPALLTSEDEAIERVFEKFLFSGDDRNLGSVFVRGRVIGGARPLAE